MICIMHKADVYSYYIAYIIDKEDVDRFIGKGIRANDHFLHAIEKLRKEISKIRSLLKKKCTQGSQPVRLPGTDRRDLPAQKHSEEE